MTPTEPHAQTDKPGMQIRICMGSSCFHPPPCEGGAKGDKDISQDDDETGRLVPVPAVQIEFLENILRLLSHDLSSLPEKASWTVMGQKITQFLGNYIHIPSVGMNPEDQERDLLILDKIGELLHTLCVLDCLGEEVTLDQFIDTFIDACRQETLPIGLKNGRGVKVLDAMSARGDPFRALFVLGLNEKVFPRAISEEPFLRDHVRRRLSEVLGNVIPEKLRGFDEERLLFSFLLNAAREQTLSSLRTLRRSGEAPGSIPLPYGHSSNFERNVAAHKGIGGIEAILQANADTPAVEADADAILQALVNLLTNALHALEGFEGRRTVQVTVAPEEDGWAVLAVCDSGPGIAPEHLDRVFDPFFTTKPEGKGTGLGLSLVAATVRDHHGVIDVESAPGRGACFKILLPVGSPAGAAAERPVEADAGASSGAAAPMGTALAGGSVLVVDDEPAVAGVLDDILAPAGARATVERDAAHALELILAAPPDAVIWDYSLAGLPGPALLRELECRAPQAVQRVVFASGDLLPSAPAEDGHGPPVLLKPFDVATVLRTTAAVVRGRQGAG